MWPFSTTTSLVTSGILKGMTDYHTHLLPGVDDGVKTLEESMQILAGMERLGVRQVWLTPHIMEDLPNTTRALEARFGELKTAYKGILRLHLAAEYMMDNLFEERLAKEDLLPVGESGSHLLVETSCFNPPMALQNLFLRIKRKGYYPLLAHPERYAYMTKEDYRHLLEAGVKFQLNLFSLVGAYGAEARKKAAWLVKNGYYPLCGSDVHSLAVWEGAITEKKIPENISGSLQRLARTPGRQ